MKCTECSRTIQPIVAVDIDGVLGNYHDQFTQWASWYLGQDLPYHYRGDVEFSDFLGLEKIMYRQIKLAYRQGGVKRWMPTFAGAISFMNELKELGVEVWIASTRPWDRLDNIDPDTRHWLERNKIPYDHLLYGDDKYHQLEDQVNPDRIICVIEDLLDQCFLAERLFGNVVWQPEREFTEGQKYVRRFVRWDDVLVDVEVRLRKWRDDGQR